MAVPDPREHDEDHVDGSGAVECRLPVRAKAGAEAGHHRVAAYGDMDRARR